MPTAGSRHRTARRAGLLLGLLGLIIAVQGGVVAPSSPVVSVQPEQAAAAAPATDNSTRPDRVSAMVTAIAAGTAVEDLSQRTQTTQVSANPDGTWTADTAAAPVRVQDTDGEWHDIDTTLVARSGGFAPAYATSNVVFSNGGDKVLAAMTEADRDLAWKTAANLPAPVLNGSTATYAGAAAGGADLVVTATPTGFEQSIVLHQAPTSELSLVTPVTTDGARLTETAQGGLRITADGETLVTAPAPAMWDASTDASGSPDNTAPVDTAVTTSGATTRVTLRPDQDFLTDPDTVYPVTVDPTYSTDVSADTYITNASGTQVSQESSTQLWVGTNDGGTTKARALIRWATQPWIGQDVVSASLRLQNFYSTNCTAASIMARRITSSWRADTVTWANQPSASTTDQAAFGTAYGASGCAANEAAWNVTDMVTHAADGTAPMQGIQLIANVETNNASWRKYRSSETNYAPRMVVTYNQRPGTPTKPSVTPGNAGYATTGRPTFMSTVSDADGASRAVFYVYNSGGTQVWTGSTGTLTGSSAKATLTIPSSSSALADGAYTLKVRGYDGRMYSSAYSVATSFIVDTARPGVTVAASGFTSGTWNHDPPATSTLSFDGPSDTSSFAWTIDGVAQKTMTANASGDASTTWHVENGSHMIRVTPTDKAGNSGPGAGLNLGAGRPQFSAPDEYQESGRAFSMTIDGPPNAMSATLSWRYSGDTPWQNATGVQTASGSNWTGAVNNRSDGLASTTGPLIWDATQQKDPGSNSDPSQQLTLRGPALIELQVCLSYSGNASSCTSPRSVQLLSGFDGNLPTTTVGPMTLALTTGEATLVTSDAVDLQAGIGRTFDSFDSVDGLFGPGWASDTFSLGGSGTSLIDNREKDGSLVVEFAQGGYEVFVPASEGAAAQFKPAATDNGDRITLAATGMGSLDQATLTQPDGSQSVWRLDESEEWILNATTTPTTVTTMASNSAGDPIWIAETDPGTSQTCTAVTQSVGCRGLAVVYTTVAGHTRVAQLTRKGYDLPDKTVATYSYDASGKLVKVCGIDPDTSEASASLCETYGYSTTIGGRVVLASVTPPGQKAWQILYDAYGRVAQIKRALDPATDAASTEATWTVAYDLNPSSAGMPDLSSSTVTSLGQSETPTIGYGVFGPGTDPAITKSGKYWFVNAGGSLLNTAEFGASSWLVDTYWYDKFGNVVRTLDATGRARALDAPADRRGAVALDASTLYSFDATGRRVEDQYGPTHQAGLKDGTFGPFRTHTAFTYDDEDASLAPGRPSFAADDPPLDLVTQQKSTTSSSDMTQDFEPTLTRWEYSPNVAGDGDGWDFQIPTRVKTQRADGTWSTEYSRFTSDGNPIAVTEAGGALSSSGVGTDALTTTTSYYSSSSQDADCAVGTHVAWVGLTCKVSPNGQPQQGSTPYTYYAAYDQDAQPLSIQERSGQVTRTTDYTYDPMGRPTSTLIHVTGTPQNTADIRTDIAYDPAGGQVASRSFAGRSIDLAYDSWGRVHRYTDDQGHVATTTYTVDDQLATRTAGSLELQFKYMSPEEQRSLPTSVEVTQGTATKSFGLTYNAGGRVSRLTYPNGLTADYGYDEAGYSDSLEYTSAAGDPLLQFQNSLDSSGNVTSMQTPASSTDFTYDSQQRLLRTVQRQANSCDIRTYQYDTASHRTGYREYGATSGTGDPVTCQDSQAAVAVDFTYDPTGRVTTNGFAYDALGRATTVPQSATRGTGAMSLTYAANDFAESISQQRNGQQLGTQLQQDALGRVGRVVNTYGGTESVRRKFAYADDTDRPAYSEVSSDGGTNWTEEGYVYLPGVGTVASVSGQTMSYWLQNLKGDKVSEVTDSPVATPLSYSETDEFGNQLTSSGPRSYGWLGSQLRYQDVEQSVVVMGARLYVPGSGMFASPDPVPGGNRTPYGYPEDPVNTADLDGRDSRGLASGSAIAGYCATLAKGPCLLFGLISAKATVLSRGISDDKQKNAIRHFMWMATMTALIGYKYAKKFGDLHELGEENGPHALDSYIDQANNRKARDYAMAHGDYLRNMYHPHWYEKYHLTKVMLHVRDVGYYYWGRHWLYQSNGHGAITTS